MRASRLASATLGLLLWTTLCSAQDTIKTLSQMKSTGGGADWQSIQQTGSFADKIRKNLEKVKLPEGFKISLFAIAPDAGHMAVGPQGVAVFAGTRKSDVWVITDRNKDRVADEVKRFAPTISFRSPSGVCFSKDGFLYIVEQNRVLVFPGVEFTYESADVAVAEIVPQGKLVPPEENSQNQAARDCEVGPDNKLYISLGQPLIVSPEKAELDTRSGTGETIRIDRDGTKREALVRSDDNSTGQDEHIQPTHSGMLIYMGTMFPENYRGIFSAQQTRVMFLPRAAEGNAGKIFIEGWHQPTEDIGHLVDIVELHDGSILVSDELAGAIYRISYGE